MSKRVLFLCGSPRRKGSASLYTARYLAQFLDHDYEFLDVVGAKLSANPTEAEPAFLEIVGKMQGADAVVWTFGAWVYFVSVQMQYLLDKLFSQPDYHFFGKVAAAVMTSTHIQDDFILDRVRFISEQLGLGYIGDVSAAGNPFFGYVGDEEATEYSCRVLAGLINRALSDGHVPSRYYSPVERTYLSSTHRGPGFSLDSPAAQKTGGKSILIITGNRLAEDDANASIVEAIRRYSRNNVETIELQDRNVAPCVGCYLCATRVEGICVLNDEYETINRRTHEVDGIVLVGTCASGMVDCHLKAFLDRWWGNYHRPSLTGKYGFVVATGGGPLEADAAWHLKQALNMTGTRCISALTQSAADAPQFAASLQRAAEDLDRAMDEKWQMPDRFDTRAARMTFRDLVATSGMFLRADHKFYKEQDMFDYPSPGGVNAVLRVLFKSRRLEKRLTAMRQRQLQKDRKKRLDVYLQSGGRLGKGKEILS